MEEKFISKISTLSTIPEKSISQLQKYLNAIASHDIVTQMVDGNNVFEIDTFEGKIYITLDDDILKYKFIPSEAFDKIIRETIIDRQSVLIEALSEKLKDSLVNTYKDLL